MEKEMLLEELTKNCKEKMQKLLDLMEAFDLACLGYDMQEQHSKDIFNRVLSENEFFCARHYSRDLGYDIGDRILDEDFMFMLSEEDFNRVMELSRPISVEEKLTDEEGNYLEHWADIRANARRELVNFIIDEMVPKAFRHHFNYHCMNIVATDKLINIFRNLTKKAA